MKCTSATTALEAEACDAHYSARKVRDPHSRASCALEKDWSALFPLSFRLVRLRFGHLADALLGLFIFLLGALAALTVFLLRRANQAQRACPGRSRARVADRAAARVNVFRSTVGIAARRFFRRDLWRRLRVRRFLNRLVARHWGSFFAHETGCATRVPDKHQLPSQTLGRARGCSARHMCVTHAGRRAVPGSTAAFYKTRSLHSRYAGCRT